jgi:hypothetical protein
MIMGDLFLRAASKTALAVEELSKERGMVKAVVRNRRSSSLGSPPEA